MDTTRNTGFLARGSCSRMYCSAPSSAEPGAPVEFMMLREWGQGREGVASGEFEGHFG